MVKWEYAMFTVNIYNSKFSAEKITAKNICDIKDSEGNSDFDKIAKYGKNGWELVSTTPVAEFASYAAYTKEILFTFKRPLE